MENKFWVCFQYLSHFLSVFINNMLRCVCLKIPFYGYNWHVLEFVCIFNLFSGA